MTSRAVGATRNPPMTTVLRVAAIPLLLAGAIPVHTDEDQPLELQYVVSWPRNTDYISVVFLGDTVELITNTSSFQPGTPTLGLDGTSIRLPHRLNATILAQASWRADRENDGIWLHYIDSNWTSAGSMKTISASSRRSAAQPSVISAAGDPQHPAHRRHTVIGLVRLHELEDLPGTVTVSRANQAAAFFRISRSSRSCRFSRRRRRSSSRSAVVRPSSRRPSSRSACRN